MYICFIINYYGIICSF